MVAKTVTLKIKSENAEDEVEVSKELWIQFEKRAEELKVPVEKLFAAALSDFLAVAGHCINEFILPADSSEGGDTGPHQG